MKPPPHAVASTKFFGPSGRNNEPLPFLLTVVIQFHVFGSGGEDRIAAFVAIVVATEGREESVAGSFFPTKELVGQFCEGLPTIGGIADFEVEGGLIDHEIGQLGFTRPQLPDGSTVREAQLEPVAPGRDVKLEIFLALGILHKHFEDITQLPEALVVSRGSREATVIRHPGKYKDGTLAPTDAHLSTAEIFFQTTTPRLAHL